MKFIDIIRMCLRNLTKHKMRTLLTVTGVLIGTCAIIVMISLGIGMNEAQTAMISEWADLTLIQVYNYGYGENGEKPADMTDDVLTQFKEMDHVKTVTPFYTGMQSGNTIGIYSDEYVLNWAPLVGVYMDALEDFGYKLKEGRWATDKDPRGTVLFGQLAVSDLYQYEDEENVWSQYDENYNIIDPILDPLKDSFRIVPISRDTTNWTVDYSSLDESSIENREYGTDLNVVGIVEGNWNDYYTMNGVFIDIDFMKELINGYNELNPDNQYEEFKGVYTDVRIRVDDMNNVSKVESALKEMGYQTSSSNEMRENMMKQTQTIQMMLGALAAISLFVAALNITNTMIMSIIERTKEIGVMKVLGCNIRDIRIQFLGEAASIGFIGGVVGIGISYLGSFLINTFLKDTLMGAMGGNNYGMGSTTSDISVIPPWLIFGALAFATIIGLVSGFYPANKAVKISALAAISNE